MKLIKKFKKKKIVGFTTGVFDLFHIGHLNILRKAKKKCDYLIVGVSTDKLTQQMKNKKPIIPYKERKKIVQAIKYVDKVVPQKFLDRNKLWEKYNFNIMFHGDDVLFDPIRLKFDQDLIKKHNVKIIYFKYTKTTSSTLITQVLNKLNKK